MTEGMNKKEIIRKYLTEAFPHPNPPLEHKNSFELLIAVILSAQTTDIAVNKVTNNLFKKYPDINSLANASLKDVENCINTLGLYKSKASYIINTAKMIRDEFNGIVPNSLTDLTKLPGVGPKTAKVVLGQAFNKNYGFAVDTHVIRLANKWGLTEHKQAEKVAKDLEKFFKEEKDEWKKLSLQIIFWGRKNCPARIKKENECIICKAIEKC